MEAQNKWYNNRILTHLLVIIIFPIGLYALWKSPTIAKWWKVTLTLFVSFIVIGSILPEPPVDNNQAQEEVVELEQEASLTPEQLDSIAKAERQIIADKRIEEIAMRKESTIDAQRLFQIYESNEVLADKEFKDKNFYVSGMIQDIGKDLLDDIYVTLEVNNLMFTVQCFIDDEEAVSKLKKGIKVTLLGRCDGKFGNVVMKKCELVKNLEDL